MEMNRLFLLLAFSVAIVVGEEAMRVFPPYAVMVDASGAVTLALEADAACYPSNKRLLSFAPLPPIDPAGKGLALPEQTIRSYLDVLQQGKDEDIADLCADAQARELHINPEISGAKAPEDMILGARIVAGRYCIVYCQRIFGGKPDEIGLEFLKRDEERQRWLFTGDISLSHVFQTMQTCSGWIGQNYPASSSFASANMQAIPVYFAAIPEISFWEKPIPPLIAIAPMVGTQAAPREPDCRLLAKIGPGFQKSVEDAPDQGVVAAAINELRQAFAERDHARIRHIWGGGRGAVIPENFLGWASDTEAKTWVVGVIGHPGGEMYLLESGPEPAVPPAAMQPAKPHHFGALSWCKDHFSPVLYPDERFNQINQLLKKPELWSALARSCARK